MVKKIVEDKLDEILNKISLMKGIQNEDEFRWETGSLEGLILDLKKLQGLGGFNGTIYNRDYMAKRQVEIPYNGKLGILNDLKGTIFYNGNPIALVDSYILFRKEDGWDGWANLAWNTLNPELRNFLREHKTAYYEIEIEKKGKKTKSLVQGKNLGGGGRRYRLEFKGIGELNL